MATGREELNYRALILQFVGICMVVFQHTGVGKFWSADLFEVGSFHMALFVFISGYLYKGTERLVPYIWKKIKHLLFPYYAWLLVEGGGNRSSSFQRNNWFWKSHDL